MPDESISENASRKSSGETSAARWNDGSSRTARNSFIMIARKRICPTSYSRRFLPV